MWLFGVIITLLCVSFAFGYELTLGTRWLGYELTVGTSWLGTSWLWVRVDCIPSTWVNIWPVSRPEFIPCWPVSRPEFIPCQRHIRPQPDDIPLSTWVNIWPVSRPEFIPCWPVSRPEFIPCQRHIRPQPDAILLCCASSGVASDHDVRCQCSFSVILTFTSSSLTPSIQLTW